MLKAFVEYYDNYSNNLAEASALLNGVNLCINEGLINIVVESDLL